MEITISGYDHQTLPLALEALHALAAELPLEVILLELRRFYRVLWDDSSTETDSYYHQICDTCLRSLDAALRRMEIDAR